ncbi:hypothetical protein LWI28_010823 [Acer negundo]|uniref:Uncharacterized protein n=1 Tax=Acer negundo TaxID=4023 RepID=A0AAD5NN63_ACENE|nr:hypothetical protein LWI28_010823 [Acer negundo]
MGAVEAVYTKCLEEIEKREKIPDLFDLLCMRQIVLLGDHDDIASRIKVIEVCKRGLRIENPTESGVEQLFSEDRVLLSNESRIESEKKTIMMRLPVAETQKSNKFVAKRAVEVVYMM